MQFPCRHDRWIVLEIHRSASAPHSCSSPFVMGEVGWGWGGEYALQVEKPSSFAILFLSRRLLLTHSTAPCSAKGGVK